MKLPLLKDNVTSYIAIGYMIMYFVMKLTILFYVTKVSETILVQIESSMDNIAILILGYYFGASKKPSTGNVNVENVENIGMNK